MRILRWKAEALILGKPALGELLISFPRPLVAGVAIEGAGRENSPNL